MEIGDVGSLTLCYRAVEPELIEAISFFVSMLAGSRCRVGDLETEVSTWGLRFLRAIGEFL